MHDIHIIIIGPTDHESHPVVGTALDLPNPRTHTSYTAHLNFHMIVIHPSAICAYPLASGEILSRDLDAITRIYNLTNSPSCSEHKDTT